MISGLHTPGIISSSFMTWNISPTILIAFPYEPMLIICWLLKVCKAVIKLNNGYFKKHKITIFNNNNFFLLKPDNSIICSMSSVSFCKVEISF